MKAAHVESNPPPQVLFSERHAQASEWSLSFMLPGVGHPWGAPIDRADADLLFAPFI
ncbi:hypothetical protein M419DRAFT_120522 [Trichoderma reesei RUT C-30]|uniref:Uncharacterized protein n=1 Tax=Hypocrea jecorina (strain ATCC 56765 / BCRC 32924 / NRRL 11460 / Rut C-30) TaxID=1344414 RepID=A0A024RZW2_HYPJR|nr:hypothetical protein M419DRAFT_120522 [Trichoderma reesei RUT C-30]